MAPTLPVYLDNHSTTRCDPAVVEAMLPWFTEHYGNAASRSHSLGYAAKAAVELARERVAALIGASPKEIVFTSGATEADNLAVLGLARGHASKGRHVITAATEHKAVLDSVDQLAREGFDITVLPVDAQGRVTPEQVAEALRHDTVLVSIMLANNEVGTVQPIGAIGAVCRDAAVPFHTDAVQGLGKIPVHVGELGVDLLSLSAHKMYGPKGIGALYVRRGRPRLKLVPLLHGGGHERGLRSGTLAVPLIVGLGVASEQAARDAASGLPTQRALRDRLWHGLAERIDGVQLNGPPLDGDRLPNNLNLSFESVEAEALMMAIRDIAVSSGSACTSATLEPSHVLRAMGVPSDIAHASIRFGLGRFNDQEQIDYVIDRLATEVPRLRAMSPRYGSH